MKKLNSDAVIPFLWVRNENQDAIEKEIDKVESDIADLEMKISERDETQSAELNIIPTTQKLLDNYNDLTPREKNDLWKEVLSQVTYRKTEKKGKFHITIYPKLPKKPM